MKNPDSFYGSSGEGEEFSWKENKRWSTHSYTSKSNQITEDLKIPEHLLSEIRSGKTENYNKIHCRFLFIPNVPIFSNRYFKQLFLHFIIGRCIAFVGAGFSAAARLPGW